MQLKRDYYETLGVSRGAGEEEIRKAFRRLAFQFHPDRNHEPDAEARFKEINEAYQCLCDAGRRRTYDLRGRPGLEGSQYADFGFGGLGEIFETFFGSAFGEDRANAPMQGETFRFSATITLEEVATGTTREFSVKRSEPCADCNGTGCQPGTSPLACPDCSGTGKVRRNQQSIFGRFSHIVRCPGCKGAGSTIPSPCYACRGRATMTTTRTLNVNIPAGIDTNGTVTLRGQGSVGSNGGRAGDVIIVVEVQPHEIFTRDGLNIYCELPVNFAQAALGAEVVSPALCGTVDVRVPANTQTGATLRLKGKGLPELKGKRHGDQLLHVRVTTPRKLTKEQRRLFEALAQTMEGK